MLALKPCSEYDLEWVNSCSFSREGVTFMQVTASWQHRMCCSVGSTTLLKHGTGLCEWLRCSTSYRYTEMRIKWRCSSKCHAKSFDIGKYALTDIPTPPLHIWDPPSNMFFTQVERRQRSHLPAGEQRPASRCKPCCHTSRHEIAFTPMWCQEEEV